MKILVTGYLGFVGRNMMSFLHKQEGVQVDGYEWDDSTRPSVRQYDWVIHLADVHDSMESDVESILGKNYDFSCWLLDECQRQGVNLQYASSSTVYGDTKNFEETAPCNPLSTYAWSKYLFDRYAFQKTHTSFVQGFRYFSVYGKWQHVKAHKTNAIHQWRQQARKEGHVTVWENADKVKRDWVWVGDVCKLHWDFIQQVKGSGIWNVGSGLSHSYLDLAEYIAEQEGVPVITEAMPKDQYVKNRSNACANLKHLKETIGRRAWLNVYEWLDYDK
jgi:ADP-L-glycero-D-manno-heptose 6-epimerase